MYIEPEIKLKALLKNKVEDIALEFILNKLYSFKENFSDIKKLFLLNFKSQDRKINLNCC